MKGRRVRIRDLEQAARVLFNQAENAESEALSESLTNVAWYLDNERSRRERRREHRAYMQDIIPAKQLATEAAYLEAVRRKEARAIGGGSE